MSGCGRQKPFNEEENEKEAVISYFKWIFKKDLKIGKIETDLAEHFNIDIDGLRNQIELN